MSVYHFVHLIPYQCFQEKKRQKKQVQGNEKTIAFSYTGRQEILSSLVKGLGSRRGEIGPAIEMHTDFKYVYMVYFIEKKRNSICLVLKL